MASRVALRLADPGFGDRAPLMAGLRRLFRVAHIRTRMRKNGIRPVRFLDVSLDRLFFQLPIRCEMSPVADATPVDVVDRFFLPRAGTVDRRVVNSPHYRTLRDYHNAQISDLSNSDYWRFHVALRDDGLGVRTGQHFAERTDEWIASKVQILLRVLDSIQANGYDYSKLANYIWVLERPLIYTRYGYDYRLEGYEIFDGHHRAAAVACLGYPSVRVLLLKDVGTHTRFGVPLEEVVAPTNG